jgi:hypothetical protein
MSTTLTYGLKRPETGDLGSVWFPNLEDNFTRLDAHDHDGTDSSLLPLTSITKQTTTIASGDWVDQGGGTYRQEVIMPAGLTFAGYTISLRTAAGEQIFPTVKLGSAANKYYVYVNDNTLVLTATYV